MTDYSTFTLGQLDLHFLESCENNQLDLIKILLTSHHLRLHADIHACDDRGLQVACRQGNLEMVNYLLTSPELKDHANPYANAGSCLVEAYENKHLYIVQLLLYDVNMQVPQAVYSSISDDKKRQGLRHLVAKRDLFLSLQADLGQQEEKKSATPVKI